MSRRAVLFAALPLAVLAFAACGSDDPAGDPTDGTPLPVPTLGSPNPTTEPTPTIGGDAPSTVAGDGSTPADVEADFAAAFGTNYAVFETDDENDCVGQVIVDAVGLDALEASSVEPADVIGIITLDDAGLSVDQAALSPAVDSLTSCGDLAAISLASGSGTPEQTECAAGVVTNELAAEQLLVQITGLEPSADLVAARDALGECAAG